MSPTEPDRARPVNQPGADRSTDGATYSISEAASALGLSTDAVRSRLRRGTLTGEKTDGEWRVVLPADEVRPVDQPVTDRSQPGNQPVSDRARPVDRPPDGDLARMLERADNEIAWLRLQLEERDRALEARSRELASERERSDVLHREAFARIEALTASLVGEDPDDDESLVRPTATPSESPQTHEDGPGAATGEGLSVESNPAPVLAQKRSFWARLFRG